MMIKKLFSMLLAGAVLLTFNACGDGNKTDDGEQTDTQFTGAATFNQITVPLNRGNYSVGNGMHAFEFNYRTGGYDILVDFKLASDKLGKRVDLESGVDYWDLYLEFGPPNQNIPDIHLTSNYGVKNSFATIIQKDDNDFSLHLHIEKNNHIIELTGEGQLIRRAWGW